MSNQRRAKIDRRAFLFGATGTVVGLHPSASYSWTAAQTTPAPDTGNCLFVSNQGRDANPGSELRPLKTFHAAKKAVAKLRKSTSGPITVYFRAGAYYLLEPIVFRPEDSDAPEAPIIYSAYPVEHVTLSGGTRLAPLWTPYRGGILQTPVPPGTYTDQLFVNGERQILARYPNYDPDAKYLNGYAADAISPERDRRWAYPRGGYIHTLHQYLWGRLHFEIIGKDASGNPTYEGGWQNNRPASMHAQYRFVENIFEELDAPGEWFLDKGKRILYFYPPPGSDLKNAVIEVVRLKHLVEMRGTADAPERWIGVRGFTFRHTARTFMETREPLLRSDWRIYSGGALHLSGTEDCHVGHCEFDDRRTIAYHTFTDFKLFSATVTIKPGGPEAHGP